MSEQPLHHPAVSRPALWFGLLGGAIAWFIHLFLVYLIAEFGCLTGLRDVMFLGITAVAWLGLAVSVATLLAAVAATVAAWRCGQQVQTGAGETADARGSESYFARVGLIMSGLFVFVILVESVPIFYFLKDC